MHFSRLLAFLLLSSVCIAAKKQRPGYVCFAREREPVPVSPLEKNLFPHPILFPQLSIPQDKFDLTHLVSPPEFRVPPITIVDAHGDKLVPPDFESGECVYVDEKGHIYEGTSAGDVHSQFYGPSY